VAGGRCAWPNVAPNEHERQHHISPGGTQTNRPCQYGGDHGEFHVFTLCSRRGHFAHRTTQRVLWSTDCKSPAMVPRYGTRLAVDHGSNARDPFWACNTNPAQRRGAPASRYVSTVKPFEMSTRLRARRNRVLFRYGYLECGTALRFWVADVQSRNPRQRRAAHRRVIIHQLRGSHSAVIRDVRMALGGRLDLTRTLTSGFRMTTVQDRVRNAGNPSVRGGRGRNRPT
jgi:hypothetical protein